MKVMKVKKVKNEDIARAVMQQVTTNLDLIDNYVDDFYSFGEGDWATMTQDELIADFTIYLQCCQIIEGEEV